MHESIAKRAWWGLLILPCVGYTAFSFTEGRPPLSIGSIAYSLLYMDPLLKINSMFDAFDSGYLNSNEFSEEINACFDSDSKLSTETTTEEVEDTISKMKAIRILIIII